MKADQVKPFYLYLVSGLFFIVSSKIKDDQPALYYVLMAVGLMFFIWGVVKYFRE